MSLNLHATTKRYLGLDTVLCCSYFVISMYSMYSMYMYNIIKIESETITYVSKGQAQGF
jgi:hypothetical protein